MAGSSFVAVAAVITSSLLMGGLWTMFVSLSRAAKEKLQLDDRRGIGLRVCFTAAMILLTFVGGILVNTWGPMDVLIIGALLGCFSIATLGLSRDFTMAVAAATMMGAATGILHTATTVAMPAAFYPGDNAMEHAPGATNLGYVFVMLGCILMPMVCQWSIGKFGFRNALLALALVAVIPAGFATLASDAPEFANLGGPLNLAVILGDVRLWIAVAGVFCYFALEISAIQWMRKFLVGVGYQQRWQLVMMAGFWGLFLGARLLSTSIVGYVGFAWLLLILTVISAAVLGNIISHDNRTGAGWGFLLLGACVGPIFPTLVGQVLSVFHAAPFQQPAVAFGLIFALGATGRLIAEPIMIQQVAKERTRLAMCVTLILLLILLIPALVLFMMPPW